MKTVKTFKYHHRPIDVDRLKPGTKVKYLPQGNGENRDRILAAKFLVPGSIYTIESADIGSYSSSVSLERVYTNLGTPYFNSVLFVYADEKIEDQKGTESPKTHRGHTRNKKPTLPELQLPVANGKAKNLRRLRGVKLKKRKACSV